MVNMRPGNAREGRLMGGRRYAAHASIACGILGTLPMCLIAAAEVYGALTGSALGFLGILFGAVLFFPCLAFGAISLITGFRARRRDVQAGYPAWGKMRASALGIATLVAAVIALVMALISPPVVLGPGG